MLAGVLHRLTFSHDGRSAVGVVTISWQEPEHGAEIDEEVLCRSSQQSICCAGAR